MLQKAGAAFILELTNPTQNSDKYIIQKDQALNLGVYGADFGYVGTYNKTKEVKEYFVCLKKLSDNLGINTKFTSNVSQNLEENLANKDSLHNIITNSYFDTFNYLNNNGRGNVAFLVLAGGWIESIFITSQLAITAKDKKQLIEQITNQKKSYSSLLLLSEVFKDDADVSATVAKMKKVGSILEKSGEALSETQLFELADAIEVMRNEIVNAK